MEQQGNAIQEMVKQGMAVMRVENDVQIQMSVQRPRDEEKVFDKIMRILDVVPSFAEDAFYSIPYKDNASGTTKPVEGLTIKAAMEIIRNWGNAASGARVVDDLDDRIIVEGVVVDYENNVRVMRQVSVSKTTWSKQENRFKRLAPDPMNIAIQAGMSKAARNAVFQIIPEWIKDSFFMKAKHIVANPPKQISATVQTMEEKLNKAKNMFMNKLGVTPEEIKEYVSGLSVETDEDLLAHLRGLWNGIKEGELTVDSVFGRPQKTGVQIPKEKSE